MLGIRGEALVYSPTARCSTPSARVFQQGDLPHSGGRYRPAGRRRPDAGPRRVLRRRHLQRLHPVPGRPRRLPRRAYRHPRRRGLLPLLRLPHAAVLRARPRMPRSPPTCGSRSMRRAPGSARATSRAPAPPWPRSLAAGSESDFVYSAIGHGHLDMAWLWPLRETRRKAARTYTRAAQRDRRHARLHLRHQPAAAAVLDEAAAARPLRADQEGRRRRPHGAAGHLLGRDRHQPARRRIARAAGDGRPPVPAARNSACATTTCGSAGCPTPSATTATCRRSCARAAWTGS